MSDAGNGLVLGIVGTAIGVVAVDYAMSEPGESWVAKISSSLGLTSFASALPMHGESHADVRASPRSHSAHPVPPTSSQRRPLPIGPVPLTITPAMVNQIASKLNLQANGIITEEMKRAISSLQTQLGIQSTGFPDPKTLQALGIGMNQATSQVHALARKAAKASPIADAGNFISKTFGGPPSSHATGPDEGVRKLQHMLNTFFNHHVVEEDGVMGTNTSSLIQEFQTSQGLPKTGVIDSKTQETLNKLVSEGANYLSASLHRTGAEGVSTWKSESQSLGDAAQNIISKVMTDGDPKKVQPLSKLLKLAGFPVTSAAVASSHGGGTATSGFSYYPEAAFGW